MRVNRKTTGPLSRILAHLVWISLFLSGLLVAPLPGAAQQASIEQQQVSEDNGPKQPSELPDSPGAMLAQAQAPPVPQNTPSQPSISPETAPQKPVGTAAAEAPNASGVAASEPAGVAIAPAKQRRARTIIIRTGAIIGAAVAVGAVVALSAGTSSKPSGAH